MQNTFASATNLHILCSIVLEDYILVSQAMTMSHCVFAVAITLSSSLVLVEKREK